MLNQYRSRRTDAAARFKLSRCVRWTCFCKAHAGGFGLACFFRINPEARFVAVREYDALRLQRLLNGRACSLKGAAHRSLEVANGLHGKPCQLGKLSLVEPEGVACSPENRAGCAHFAC